MVTCTYDDTFTTVGNITSRMERLNKRWAENSEAKAQKMETARAPSNGWMIHPAVADAAAANHSHVNTTSAASEIHTPWMQSVVRPVRGRRKISQR